MYNKEAAEGLKKKLKRWSDTGLNARIGGLLHDSVAIVTTELNLKVEEKGTHTYDMAKRIKHWLDTLYEIGDKKIAQIKQKELNKYDQAEDKLSQVNQELQEKADEENREEEANPIRETEMKHETYTTPRDLKEDIPVLEE